MRPEPSSHYTIGRQAKTLPWGGEKGTRRDVKTEGEAESVESEREREREREREDSERPLL